MTYEKISLSESKERANYINELFRQNNLTINKSSHLGKLLTTIENIKSDKITELQAIEILDLNRLFDALDVMKLQTIEKTMLKRLRKGKLDFNDPNNDDGKNILFELEIAALFVNKGIRVKFDEPDLTIELEGKKIGIACKKIHSVKGIDKAIKKGVKQNNGANVDYAIVAVNIDNFHPVGHLLCMRTKIKAMDNIHQKNENFYKEQQKYINKHLNDNSLNSVFIDSRIKTDIKQEKPRFNNLKATTAIQSPSDEVINNKIQEILGS